MKLRTKDLMKKQSIRKKPRDPAAVYMVKWLEYLLFISITSNVYRIVFIYIFKNQKIYRSIYECLAYMHS